MERRRITNILPKVALHSRRIEIRVRIAVFVVNRDHVVLVRVHLRCRQGIIRRRSLAGVPGGHAEAVRGGIAACAVVGAGVVRRLHTVQFIIDDLNTGLVGFLQSDDLVLVAGPVMGAAGFRYGGEGL